MNTEQNIRGDLFSLKPLEYLNPITNEWLIEQFKPIKGYEGLYEISNLGRVQSLLLNKRKILKQSQTNSGYPSISLRIEGKSHPKEIHKLVWDHFGDRPRENRVLQVDHIDNCKQNNRINNLQLLSARENTVKGVGYHGRNQALPLGVCFSSKNRYRAKIRVGEHNIYLGQYETPESAHQAYFLALNMIKDNANKVDPIRLVKEIKLKFLGGDVLERSKTWHKRNLRWQKLVELNNGVLVEKIPLLNGRLNNVSFKEIIKKLNRENYLILSIDNIHKTYYIKIRSHIYCNKLNLGVNVNVKKNEFYIFML